MSIPNWRQLREEFLSSPEFRTGISSSVASHELLDDYISAPANPVDVEIPDEQIGRLVDGVRRSWERLGTERPYWSVLVDSKFMPDAIAENIEEFYSSGQHGLHLIDFSARRAGVDLPADWEVFELGCGLGRITAQLASRFRSILAYDISQPHLAIAREHLSRLGIKNTHLAQLLDINDLILLSSFDLLYCVIVLQHNPPPLIYRMLTLLFDKIRKGGLAFFQVPVAAKSYEFRVDEYLDKMIADPGGVEMHILPQRYLFQALHNGGMKILDLQRDNSTGPLFQSIIVLAQKVGEGGPFPASRPRGPV